MAKVTKATFKSFINKNAGKLHIKVESRFGGMTDCVESNNGAAFHPVMTDDRGYHENTLGIAGVWLVGGGCDYFTPIEKDGFRGFEVYNCCGTFIVATQIQGA